MPFHYVEKTCHPEYPCRRAKNIKCGQTKALFHDAPGPRQTDFAREVGNRASAGRIAGLAASSSSFRKSLPSPPAAMLSEGSEPMNWKVPG